MSKNKKEEKNNKETEEEENKEKLQYTKKIGNYILFDQIGMGTFSKVTKAIHVLTDQTVAVKISEKAKIQDEVDIERIIREIEILKNINHPNIAQMYETYSTIHNFYLMMEYVEGGDLFDYICANNYLEENKACHFFRQLIGVIEYLTEMGITHRDIKPENILIDENYENIKVIDFGLSNYCLDNELLKSSCGSPCYASPEMLSGNPYQGITTDLWSSGIVLYSMLVGSLPFDDQELHALYEQIKVGKFYLPSTLSLEAIDLLKRILQVNPNKRIKLKEIKKHPWFNIEKNPMYKGINITIEEFPYESNVVDYVISNYFNDSNEITKKDFINMIKTHACNQYTATYYLAKKYLLCIEDNFKIRKDSEDSEEQIINLKSTKSIKNKENESKKIKSKELCLNIKEPNNEPADKSDIKKHEVIKTENLINPSKENNIRPNLYNKNYNKKIYNLIQNNLNKNCKKVVAYNNIIENKNKFNKSKSNDKAIDKDNLFENKNIKKEFKIPNNDKNNKKVTKSPKNNNEINANKINKENINQTEINNVNKKIINNSIEENCKNYNKIKVNNNKINDITSYNNKNSAQRPKSHKKELQKVISKLECEIFSKRIHNRNNINKNLDSKDYVTMDEKPKDNKMINSIMNTNNMQHRKGKSLIGNFRFPGNPCLVPSTKDEKLNKTKNSNNNHQRNLSSNVKYQFTNYNTEIASFNPNNLLQNNFFKNNNFNNQNEKRKKLILLNNNQNDKLGFDMILKFTQNKNKIKNEKANCFLNNLSLNSPCQTESNNNNLLKSSRINKTYFRNNLSIVLRNCLVNNTSGINNNFIYNNKCDTERAKSKNSNDNKFFNN